LDAFNERRRALDLYIYMGESSARVWF